MSEIDFTALAAPFPADDIEWRAGATNNRENPTRAMALAYITSRAIMDRLDEVVGPANWRDEYSPGPQGGVICGISLRIGDDWVTKWDGADNTEHEAVKGGLSDAFKRAGYKWGIGRYLYKLPSPWVACEKRGKSVVLTETPRLPGWALPNGRPSQPPAKNLQDLGFPQTEAQGEPEAPPAAEPERKPAKKTTIKAGPFNPVAWLVDANLAENNIEASNIVNRYVKSAGGMDELKFKPWAKDYRGWRNIGESVDDAEAKAFAGETPR